MDTFTELSLIIVIATLMAAFMKLLKQPLIIGHILTGLLIGPYMFNLIRSAETLQVFSELGIALLLFIVGLNLSPKVIREVGAASLITGFGQVVFTTAFGFFICFYLFKFSVISSLYLAIALTFSSTIIILKLLSDMHDLERLYGKISIGFLLVQDVIAVVILIVVSTLAQGTSAKGALMETGFKGLSLLLLVFLLSLYILPKLSLFFAKTQEFLFLFSAAWGLGLATTFHSFGFSLEIGALIAGVSLSISPYSYEISAKMRPLRDFFIILFFILLGSQMAIQGLHQFILPAIALSLFVLVGNPFIVIILMGLLGYSKKTSFKAGLTVAQISEFSLILVMLGRELGHINSAIVSLTTLVGLITIACSTYLILYADNLYPKLAWILSVFEKKSKVKTEPEEMANDIILFGLNRIGYDILKKVQKITDQYLVVDFDPKIVASLTKQNVTCRYGDAQDDEFLGELRLDLAKMIISTVPDFETNLYITQKARKINIEAIILTVSHNIEETYLLYEAGASYVIMPHFLGGEFASLIIDRYQYNAEKFEKEKEKHLKYLALRVRLGHDHPPAEKFQ